MYKDYNEKKLMQDFVEESYLDYAMYVILDRALPSIIDGLKPVQRRIIYAMSELHLNYLAKHKKSARTIGDVLGKFHPHGESACYDAMVLMAQPFASRYPLIEGQGNFGTADDPKSFAAMRYTEAKLSKYAEILLEELDQGAVAWTNNFDGTLKEPKFLPAKLPMVLLNGTTGIAVGMATDILPHNLKEVADACVYILNHKDPHKIKVEDLCKYIIGPDFPTNAEIITTPQELLAVYKTGNGSVKARATYIKENNTIVITALPYMVSGAKVLKQIADQIHSKNLQQLADLRDESDHANPTRLVLVPKSNRVDLDALMLHLFATTDLEKSYRVNFNMIGSNGLPKVKNLVEILQEWIAFRLTLVTEKLTQKSKELNVRLEVLQGLLIVYLNIDAVIKIIRHEDDPKATLMKKFKLTELQVEAILDLKLRNLAKLQEIKIKDEIAQVTADLQRINQILGSKALLKDLVKTEIKELSNKLKDPRRSPVVIREEAKTFSLNSASKSTDNEITVIISEKGWVRCGKGHDIDLGSLSYKAGDSYKSHACGFYNQTVVFIDAVGKSYALSAASLPSMRGYGEPLTSKVTPDSGVGFVGVIIGNANDRVLFIQDKGFGFISEFNNLNARTKFGKSVINLGESKLLSPIKLTDLDKYCVLISDNLKMLLISIDQIVTLSKGRGAKLIKLSSKHRVLASGVLAPKVDLIISYNKHEFVIKHKDLLGYVGNIGDSGIDLPKLPKWQKNIKDLFIKSS